ncbi:hypothetical protein C8J56DRAFT_1050863 [Mycena floridula]|nr:hypothetical protein C8J56DRAFT_1050863 [Mycena floridula]
MLLTNPPAVEVPLILHKATDVIMDVDPVPPLPRPPTPPQTSKYHHKSSSSSSLSRWSLSPMQEEIGIRWDSKEYVSIMGPPRSRNVLENLTSKSGTSSRFSTKTAYSIPEEGGFLLMLCSSDKFAIENTIFPFHTSPSATPPTPPPLLAIIIAALAIIACNISALDVSAYLAFLHTATTLSTTVPPPSRFRGAKAAA